MPRTPNPENVDRFYLIVVHEGERVRSQVMAESETDAADQVGYLRRFYKQPRFAIVAQDNLTRPEAHAMTTPGVNLETLTLAEHLGRVADQTEAVASERMKQIHARRRTA